MDILLLLGITLFFGTLSGKISQRFKVPQVVAYIIVGVILGKSFLGQWSGERIDTLAPLVNLCLGIIGFLIGGELKGDLFKNRGRSIYAILFSEGLLTFFVVLGVVTLLTKKLYLGLFLGALAAATAPAATVDVLWENKARGPLSSTLLAIVALDDALALVIYGFASILARSLITKEHFSFLQSIEQPFIEIGVAALLGAVGGFFLFKLMGFIKDRERIFRHYCVDGGVGVPAEG